MGNTLFIVHIILWSPYFHTIKSALEKLVIVFFSQKPRCHLFIENSFLIYSFIVTNTRSLPYAYFLSLTLSQKCLQLRRLVRKQSHTRQTCIILFPQKTQKLKKSAKKTYQRVSASFSNPPHSSQPQPFQRGIWMRRATPMPTTIPNTVPVRISTTTAGLGYYPRLCLLRDVRVTATRV